MGIRVKQRDITDCGAACLMSIASYYKVDLPLARIRQYAGTDKNGTNVLGLLEGAEKIGFTARGSGRIGAVFLKYPFLQLPI